MKRALRQNYRFVAVGLAVVCATVLLIGGPLTASRGQEKQRPQEKALSDMRPQVRPIEPPCCDDPPPGPVLPPTKFVWVQNPIPNRYIVVLNDNVVSDVATLSSRTAQVSALANVLAQPLGGQVDAIYETALKGFSIQLPGDAAAIALSQNPQVKFVEQEGSVHVSAVQPSPPWNLDRIDQMDGLNNQYVFNGTGAGVTVYVIDSGIRATHSQFAGRAAIAADFVNEGGGGGNNDLNGHGTHVAGTVGGITYGVAKGVTIRSVKVCNFSGGCTTGAIISGVNFVTNAHNSNPSVPVVANMSLGGPKQLVGSAIDMAVTSSINSGVTYAVAAGNDGVDASNQTPADVPGALTVGATSIDDSRAFFSNTGSLVDIFAPGDGVLSSWNGSDSDAQTISGTSMASPHVAGSVALYLQGRTGMSGCGAHPISGVAFPIGGAISTCPDRVNQFIKSNGTINRLSNIGPGSPNRLLLTSSLPAPANPIDNQRFFVWQQYGDFLPYEPDGPGLEFWTGQITNHCSTGFNDNNQCTQTYRELVSRAFFDMVYPSTFNDNAAFIHALYVAYLRRSVSDSDPGFQFWLGRANSYGSPASDLGRNELIDAFITSAEYRLRFGQQ